MNVGKHMVTVFVLVAALALMTSFVVAVQPSGAQVTPGPSSRAPEDNPEFDPNALAGNVTNINLFGFTNTQSWQGYMGNVSGTIQLADSSDNVMYNWSLASPEGEVYASENNSIVWPNIACYDMSLNGSLDARYNLAADDVDGIDETFNDGNAHPMYYTNNIQFVADDCPATQLYDNTGSGVFWETLMTDDVANGENVIFTSILIEADTTGFDGTYYDFQMLVLEDGHGTDTATRTYYFWVELE